MTFILFGDNGEKIYKAKLKVYMDNQFSKYSFI